MYWERVSEEIYLFTSDRYALVNSVAVETRQGLVIVDALPFPDEAKQIARFLELRTEGGFSSLIVTHHHIDHVYGMFAFPEQLDVISHALCRKRLEEIGESSLAEARRSDPAFNEVELRIPSVTFEDGDMYLAVGDKTLRLFSLPGHSPDNIGVFIEQEEVLIAGDAVMAIPIIVDGNLEQEIETLMRIKEMAPDTLIQGHGEVILRGEVQIVLNQYIHYLECIRGKAQRALKQGRDRRELWNIPLEECGLERVPLGIASHQLHIANLLSIYDKLKAEGEGA